MGRPLPNSTLLGAFAAMTGELRLAIGPGRDPPEVLRKIGENNAVAAQAAYDLIRKTSYWRRSMWKQIEGSRAVAETVAMCRPEVICAYPITPQTHIVEGLGELVKAGKLTGCEFINVESEFGALSVAIGASAAVRAPTPRPPAKGLLFMAEAVYNASGPGPSDRDDHRQPSHRRAHQHLERPFRFDVDARRGLDPAACRNESGSRGPAHPSVSAGRRAFLPGDGVHGRLHPHARLRIAWMFHRSSRWMPVCRPSSRGRCWIRRRPCPSAPWWGRKPSREVRYLAHHKQLRALERIPENERRVLCNSSAANPAACCGPIARKAPTRWWWRWAR